VLTADRRTGYTAVTSLQGTKRLLTSNSQPEYGCKQQIPNTQSLPFLIVTMCMQSFVKAWFWFSFHKLMTSLFVGVFAAWSVYRCAQALQR